MTDFKFKSTSPSDGEDVDHGPGAFASPRHRARAESGPRPGPDALRAAMLGQVDAIAQGIRRGLGLPEQEVAAALSKGLGPAEDWTPESVDGRTREWLKGKR